jgi:hypothetical protein
VETEIVTDNIIEAENAEPELRPAQQYYPRHQRGISGDN